ncbi:hypothetical protein MRB53_012416 [Persea americana]|uniref:Uncharacterized protein n=1 Tax=Persea americana TaxID=3435 RepID=A0ACC2LXV3_PERAE|nr:hypothetical protein MRB53_012416 [Persea americana]
MEEKHMSSMDSLRHQRHLGFLTHSALDGISLQMEWWCLLLGRTRILRRGFSLSMEEVGSSVERRRMIRRANIEQMNETLTLTPTIST